MATKELEKTESAVPDLVRTPALDLDSGDIALPKLKLGQYTADAVKSQLVKPGSIYTTIGADDPDPTILLSPSGREKDTVGQDGVVFHVLGARKSWFKSEPGSSDFETADFNSMSVPEARADGWWLTYTYTIAIPSEDEDVPYVYITTKSAMPAAKQINFALMKSGRPPWYTAFALTTKFKQKGDNTWFVPVVSTSEASDESIKVAERLAVMVAGQSAEFDSTGEEPAI